MFRQFILILTKYIEHCMSEHGIYALFPNIPKPALDFLILNTKICLYVQSMHKINRHFE